MSDFRFGALPVPGGVRFRLATTFSDVRLVLHDGAAAGSHVMQPTAPGMLERVLPAAPGDRYSYRLGDDLRPDPASRYQPEGVHGPSQIVDPAFAWTDDDWVLPDTRGLVVYELHVGTFNGTGTFEAVRHRLEELAALGVTAIELMPVADFPGSRNWGYDGVCLYAPSRAYGRPDDFRRLVNDAHRHGIAVLLDVVYNHLGPEGAYLPQFLPEYLTDRHETPWGRAVNLDGPGAGLVRRFIVDNAVHWIREYHLDGLRLDATHALIDESPRHIVDELVAIVRARAGRRVVLHAEDHRNLSELIDDPPRGWGLDGVWADDFHHVVRRLLAGDRHGYYRDFAGSTRELATTLRQGWLFTGQHSEHMGHARGSDPSAVPMQRFVVCLQNHDQIGNRAMGDRLHQAIGAAEWRAASALLLTAPTTPLLFMGQEWAAGSPFQYFTDLEEKLGRLVTAGRRREFKEFPEFSDPAARERIPDPQAVGTFEASRLRWDERGRPGHAEVLALYRELLALRRAHAALSAAAATSAHVADANEGSIVMRRSCGDEVLWIAVRLKGSGRVALSAPGVPSAAGQLTTLLTTEEARFVPDPHPVEVSTGRPAAVHFDRPAAIIVKEA